MKNITPDVEGLKDCACESALLLSNGRGLAAAWNKKQTYYRSLEELKVVLSIVTKFVTPCSSCSYPNFYFYLSVYKNITKQLPVFLVIIIVMIRSLYGWHFFILSRNYVPSANPLDYNKKPCTIPDAVGTMSQIAATLSVALND